MILECILVGLIFGFFISKKKRAYFPHLELSELWISVLGAGLFLMALYGPKYLPNSLGSFIYENFSIFHWLGLFGMALGFLLPKFHPGKILVGIGFLMNGLAVFSNGKMPVSMNALLKIQDSKTIQILLQNQAMTHEILDENTNMQFLCDIIPFQSPLSGSKVMSLGDVLLALGVGIVVFSYITIIKRRETND